MIRTIVTVAATALIIVFVGVVYTGGGDLIPTGLASREADRIIRGTILYLAAIVIGAYWLFRIYLPGKKKR